MKSNQLSGVRAAWVGLYVMLFVSHAVERLLYPHQLSSDADMWFITTMFVLSFPGNLLYLGGAVCLFQAFPEFGPPDESLLWAGLFVIGYVQWFWLIPRMHDSPQLMILNLKAETDPADKVVPRRQSESSPPPAQQLTLPPHFNAQGLTPLEKALQEVLPER